MNHGGGLAASAGRRGILRLAFQMDGRTILSGQFAQAPFHVQRAVYCEESLPGMAYLYIMSTAGGVLGGDSHRMEVTLGEGARVHLTTQGATRIYDTRPGEARQTAEITLGRGSYLEFVPDQIIPYRNSRYLQETSIVADDSATMVYTEVLASGRLAMDESFQYDSCFLRTEAVDQDGHIRFADAALIEPSCRNPSEYGVMGKYTVAGTAYILAPKHHVPALYERINGAVSGEDGRTVGGASIMREGSGVLARVLGHGAEDVKAVMLSVAALVRRQILDAPLSDIRKN